MHEVRRGGASHLRRWLKLALPQRMREGLRAWRVDRRDDQDWEAWCRAPSVPPPHVVKVRTVLEYGRWFRLGTLIESGTYQGEMARKCRRGFRRIITMELDTGLARQAARRLAWFPNVEVLEGDSARLIPAVLAGLREPALFWLDGHFSGAGTARGDRETPLLEELEAIGRHAVPGHVILIDDARMLGQGDYPSLEVIRRQAAALQPEGEVVVADDIVRCTPRA